MTMVLPREETEKRELQAEILFVKGGEAEARGELEDAINLYRQALHHDPSIDKRECFNMQHLAKGSEHGDHHQHQAPILRSSSLHRTSSFSVPTEAIEDDEVSFLAYLPEELSKYLFSFFTPTSLCVTGLTCRAARLVAFDDVRWRALFWSRVACDPTLCTSLLLDPFLDNNGANESDGEDGKKDHLNLSAFEEFTQRASTFLQSRLILPTHLSAALNWKNFYFSVKKPRCDGVYISRCLYHRNSRVVGNIHQENPQRFRLSATGGGVIAVPYFRYLRFLWHSNEVLILRTEHGPKVALRALMMRATTTPSIEENDVLPSSSHDKGLFSSSSSALSSSSLDTAAIAAIQKLRSEIVTGRYYMKEQSDICIEYEEGACHTTPSPLSSSDCSSGVVRGGTSTVHHHHHSRHQHHPHQNIYVMRAHLEITHVLIASTTREVSTTASTTSSPPSSRPSSSGENRPDTKFIKWNGRMRFIKLLQESAFHDSVTDLSTDPEENLKHLRPFSFVRVKALEAYL